MATFKKFSELPEITEASESTKVPVLDGGEMKLLNGAKLGGDTGIKTAIIKSSDYNDAINNMMNPVEPSSVEPMTEDIVEYTCTNMAFDEAYQMVKNGEPLTAIGMLVYRNTPVNLQGNIVFGGTAVFGVPAIIVELMCETIITLFWTAEGILTNPPIEES